MHARWPLVFALLGIALLPRQLFAQGGSVGVPRPAAPVGGQPARPVDGRPGRRPSVPSVPSGPRPRGTITTVPFYPGARGHRPMPFRSSVFGLIAFDPYWWLAPDYGDEYVAPPPMLPPGPRPMGGLQIDVEPRRALVYVDGFLVGTVDQYKGYFQHLETTAGYHVLEFISPDYEPLITGVTVVPNQTTTYRGFLNRASGR